MEKLVVVNVGLFHLFKAFNTNSCMEMLISGHGCTDAGTDAMGCVRSFPIPIFDRAAHE